MATRLTGQTVTIREENALAALEVMSRFALDPRWLVYLPPTMSPPADGEFRPDLLEHPREAFAAYRSAGRGAGRRARRSTWARARSSSRAATPRPAARRFGVGGFGRDLHPHGARVLRRSGPGRSGPGPDPGGDRRGRAVGRAGHRLARARRRAAALVGQGRRAAPRPVRAGRRGRDDRAATRPPTCSPRPRRGAWTAPRRCWPGVRDRRALAGRFADAYRRYCWPVESAADLRLAPFQVLAGRGPGPRAAPARLAPGRAGPAVSRPTRRSSG